MQEHADYVAETLSYLQLMGGSCWRTSVTCSGGDSWVCNSVKTKHKISMSPVKQRWVACLVGGNGETRLEMENTSPAAWWSIFPAASVRYHLGLFLLPLLAFSQPYTFLLLQLCIKEKAHAWAQFSQHRGSSPAAQCPTHQQASCSLTPPWHHSFVFLNRHHRILKQTPSSRLLPFRGSLVTYKISPFSMQTVTATLTLQSLQQQALCHCKPIKFSDSV